ncbi:senescence-induced receptor-like serine/threonine-protein kinase [Coffea arabica]|uniref:Senescence-induced receptor-like serine/threonine-protein kinase n=1 Tax=Coffea arabica TaxID=13443 RepID=A0A6P6UEF0_COFAR|nr:senescence-induced receptor-like serine/threonine-protein kinase [Coffea arabica]
MQVHAAGEGKRPLISMNGRNLSEKELKFEEHARWELIPGRSSFISIDCGIENGNDYTDSETGISYTSDAQYVESGVNMKISDLFLSQTQNYQKLLSTVRSFPEGNSSCYTLKPTATGGGNKYLIRAFFMYGNYDLKSQPPLFKLYLNANEWDEVKLDNASQILIKEVIHNPPTDYIHVCLVNVGSGTPIISALEIRELSNTIYDTMYNDSLILYRRLDEGASSTISNKFQRYRDDFYDRIWEVPDYRPDWEPINTTSYITEEYLDNAYKPSPIVMSTAVTPAHGSSLVLSQNVDRNQQFYLYMHFLEVEDLPSTQIRKFAIYVNNKIWSDPVVPDSGPDTIYSTYSRGGADTLLFSIIMTNDSTLPPILNAVEFYIRKKFPILPTNQSDVDAMISIRSTYGVKKNWQGDPCVPEELRWDGLDCSTNDQGLYRIISMNLSFSGLADEITFSLSKLDSLQSLDMSHNDLTGTIPDFLAYMPSLRTINLSGNKLEGSVPALLLDKMNNGALALSLDGNPDLCLSGPCKKKKSHKQRLIVSIVLPTISCLLGIVIGVAIFKHRIKAASTKGTP